MPRDAGGTYTLVAGNPVVTDTLITSTWANATLPDIAAALTDSLDRQGRGGMLAPFKFADGTKLAPAITFTTEPTLGLFRRAAGEMAFSVASDEWVMFTAANQLQVWREDAWRKVLDAGSAQEVTGDMTFTGATVFSTAPDVGGDALITEAPEDGNQYVREDGVWVEIVPSIEAGTSMVFYQAAAPTGWTLNTDTALDNHMMRVVRTAGGTKFTGDSPILNNKVAAHNHSFSTSGAGAHNHTTTWLLGFEGGGQSGTTGINGSYGYNIFPQPSTTVGNHTHSGTSNNNTGAANWTPSYANMIVCTKDA